MNTTTLIIVGAIILLVAIIIVVIGMRSDEPVDPLSSTLAEYIERGEDISLDDVKMRFAGDTSIEAPPPEGKKKKGK